MAWRPAHEDALGAEAEEPALAVDRERPLDGQLAGEPLGASVAYGVELAPVQPGDLIAIPSCGAYTFSHSISRFTLHSTAAEAVLEGGRTVLARERGRPADALLGQRLPARVPVPALAGVPA